MNRGYELVFPFAPNCHTTDEGVTRITEKGLREFTHISGFHTPGDDDGFEETRPLRGATALKGVWASVTGEDVVRVIHFSPNLGNSRSWDSWLPGHRQ